MRIFTLFFIAMSFTQSAFSEPSEFISLWPAGQVPGEADVSLPDEAVELKGNYQIEIMSNVSVPGITLYPAPEEGNSGTTVLVCPGGGYNILAYSHEGTEVCEWLNSVGVNAVLLKYRVPRRDGLEKHHAPLQDVHRAITMIRSRSDWKGKAGKVGVLGFSAGGHLSAMAVTSDGMRTYTESGEYQKVSCVPDFGILVYPAYLQDEKSPNELSPEVKVTGDTPPLFIVVAHGDKKWVEGAAILYLAMRRNNRDAELHIFGKGGHGFGLKNTDEEIRSWSSLAGNWMRAMGYISAE